jgi:transcriptional regulator with XRE-family HTH domain
MPKGAIESPDIPSLGPRIRELRLRKGWSQEVLASRVGVRQKQISSYERSVNVPSGEILIALAKAFDVSLDYLAQMAPLNAQQVAIADLDLVEKVQLVDKLGDEERQLVKNVMDLVVMKGRVRALADQGQVAKRAEPETAAAAPGAS